MNVGFLMMGDTCGESVTVLLPREFMRSERFADEGGESKSSLGDFCLPFPPREDARVRLVSRAKDPDDLFLFRLDSEGIIIPRKRWRRRGFVREWIIESALSASSVVTSMGLGSVTFSHCSELGTPLSIQGLLCNHASKRLTVFRLQAYTHLHSLQRDSLIRILKKTLVQ